MTNILSNLKKNKNSRELAIILGIGNGATLASWLYKFPINTGPFNLGLGLSAYAYIGWKKQLHRNFRPRKLKIEPRKLILAASVGTGLALPPLVFFVFPVVVSDLDYAPIKSMSKAAVARRVLLEIPFLTAISEELLFRSYLYNQSFAEKPRQKVLNNAAIFTLWHLVVVLRTVLDTNLRRQSWLLMLSYLGGLVSIFVGGVAFAWVRERTGSFWYAALAHWLNVSLMTLGIKFLPSFTKTTSSFGFFVYINNVTISIL